jgi:hypothetical protein
LKEYHMRAEVQTKAVVCVAEMARMVGLSRARFYQLVQAGTFPLPVYDVQTRRPIYSEELQQVILEVRRHNCGVNGRPILFWPRGPRPTQPAKPSRTTSPKPPTTSHTDLIDGLRSLGLTTATATQVDAALKVLYPSGPDHVDRDDVLRAVFLFLKRQNPTGNVGR